MLEKKVTKISSFWEFFIFSTLADAFSLNSRIFHTVRRNAEHNLRNFCFLKCQKSASLPLIKFTNFQSICSFTKINKNKNKSKKKRLMAICLLLVCFLLGCSSSLGMVSRRIRDNQIKASTVKKRELNTKGKDGRLNVVGGWCVEKLENYEYTQSNRKYKSFLPKEFLGKQSHEFRILKYQA